MLNAKDPKFSEKYPNGCDIYDANWRRIKEMIEGVGLPCAPETLRAINKRLEGMDPSDLHLKRSSGGPVPPGQYYIV